MKKFLAALPLLALSACATMPYQPYAREVKKKPGEGGVIALKSDNRPEDRARADAMMATNCGSDATVKVNEEGETIVGEKTNLSTNHYRPATPAQQQKSGFRLGGINFSGNDNDGSSSSISETTQVKEWQIAYECVANAPVKKKKSISRN